MIEKRFLTVKEVATYLGLSQDTIRKWAVRGKLPVSKFGKSVRFDLKKIDSWVTEQGKEPDPPRE